MGEMGTLCAVEAGIVSSPELDSCCCNCPRSVWAPSASVPPASWFSFARSGANCPPDWSVLVMSVKLLVGVPFSGAVCYIPAQDFCWRERLIQVLRLIPAGRARSVGEGPAGILAYAARSDWRRLDEAHISREPIAARRIATVSAGTGSAACAAGG
jgi:hypothetical protein